MFTILTSSFKDRKSFISEVKTDNTGLSNNDQFVPPTIAAGTYDCVVNWGDGTSDSITTWNDAAWTHTYPSAGTYTIRITGTFEGWSFNDTGDDEKLITISQWGVLDGNLTSGFFGCRKLTNITATDIPKFLTSSTNLSALFYNCVVLTNITNVEQWTSTVASARAHMFLNCNLLNQNVSDLITSNVTNIQNMIRNTAMDQDLSSADFSGVNTATSFAAGTTMSTANYDALLVSLGGQTLISGVSIDFGSAIYSRYSTADTAHTILTEDDSWTIVDGGDTETVSTAMRLDGYITSKITKDGSDKVSSWIESYGTTYTIDQATGANKPEYVSSDKNIAFDGTSDNLATTSTIPTVLTNWTAARTLIFSVTTTSAPEGYVFTNGVTASTFRDEQIYFDESNQIIFNGEHSPGPTVTLTGSVVGAGTHTIAVRIDTSANNRAVELFLNNVSQGSAASMGVSNINPNQIMMGANPDGGGYNVAGNFFNGDVNEFILLDEFASDDDISDMHDFLTTKWGS